jgi:hypothetical protein
VTFEAVGIVPGLLRVRDLKVLGPELATAAFVDVVVIGDVGQPAFAGKVMLGRKRSGPSEHIALLCGRCLRPCYQLQAVDGELVCARDVPKRTRHQVEHNLARWRQGDQDEDRLLRLAAQGRGRMPAGIAQARELLDRITAGDADRFASLLPRVRAALEVDDT